MNKVVITSGCNGFKLSEAAVGELENNRGRDAYNIARHDKDLVETVEKLGWRASAYGEEFIVLEIPGTQYCIEYDGETCMETLICPEDVTWININE